jgi:hypothetical protein
MSPRRALLLASFVLLGACAETEVGFGEECLKDTDCLSGVCAAQLCADPGTTLTDASVVSTTPLDASKLDAAPVDSGASGDDADTDSDADAAS